MMGWLLLVIFLALCPGCKGVERRERVDVQQESPLVSEVTGSSGKTVVIQTPIQIAISWVGDKKGGLLCGFLLVMLLTYNVRLIRAIERSKSVEAKREVDIRTSKISPLRLLVKLLT